MNELQDKLILRLNILKQWIQENRWADPRDQAYSKGYDRAVSNEIAFLEDCITNITRTVQLPRELDEKVKKLGITLDQLLAKAIKEI
jgi:hypothetical protein